MQASSILKFAPLQSRIDASFWSELSERKLDHYHLSEDPISLQGTFAPSRYAAVGSQVLLDSSSFNSSPEYRQGCHVVPGTAVNLNTWDAFKASDKAALLKQVAAEVWADIKSGRSVHNPALLSRFLLLCHAELKQFHFHYWFGLPALKPPSPFQAGPATSLLASLGEQDAAQVCRACDEWLRPSSTTQPEEASPSHPHGPSPFWLVVPAAAASSSSSWAAGASCVSLSAWSSYVHAASGGAAQGSFLLAASDPSSLDSPGWPLRNLLLMVAVQMKLTSVQVLCVRESSSGRVDAGRSLLLPVELPEVPAGWCSGSVPDAVGWEANAEGRLLPRKVDLSPLMSPQLLAEQAVGLNLRLMRWRAAPDLEIHKMADAKCLLLGAGTLGCAVARCLLAWGVQTITFLDSGRVAYSNPVRQWLYELDDCTAGGKPKAQASAEALKRVFPSVLAEGRATSVPMPGHGPANAAEEESMQQAFEELRQLVCSHDAIFLLTDTRESRWLPALLAAAHGKLAITAAVGFDSFVVMRHGAPPGRTNGPKDRLGCYFCNDVVGPLNSTQNRTLDQQCTVARPGLAPIASALSVEVLAALVQHPAGVCAPAASLAADQGQQLQQQPPLGPVPHMIRGQLSGFSQTCMVGHASRQCTACSAAVVESYQQRGWPFILEAIKDPKVLEQVSGLAELHEGMEALLGEGDEEDDMMLSGGGAAGTTASSSGAEQAGASFVSGSAGDGAGDADGAEGEDWCEL